MTYASLFNYSSIIFPNILTRYNSVHQPGIHPPEPRTAVLPTTPSHLVLLLTNLLHVPQRTHPTTMTNTLHMGSQTPLLLTRFATPELLMTHLPQLPRLHLLLRMAMRTVHLLLQRRQPRLMAARWRPRIAASQRPPAGVLGTQMDLVTRKARQVLEMYPGVAAQSHCLLAARSHDLTRSSIFTIARYLHEGLKAVIGSLTVILHPLYGPCTLAKGAATEATRLCTCVSHVH